MLTVVIDIFEIARDRGIIATKISIIPSRDRRDIKKWWR
jgi:hypothetical protein